MQIENMIFNLHCFLRQKTFSMVNYRFQFVEELFINTNSQNFY